MIKTLVFDLGGVVLTDDDHVLHVKEFLDTFKINEKNAIRGWLKAWPLFKIGKITEDEFWSLLLSEAGSNNFKVDTAKKLWRNTAKAKNGMFALLKKLKPYYRMAILSNIGREHLVFKIKKFKLKKYFNRIVASGIEGLSKPDPAFFKLLFKRIDTPIDECFFIDDRHLNVSVSIQLGMKSVQFINSSHLKSSLNSYGVSY